MQNNKYTGINPQARLLLGLLALPLAPSALAGTFELGEEVRADYLVNLSYGAAMRTEDQSSELIDGPLDAFGLPATANSDDGNRNFERGSLINNRLSVLAELDLKYRNYGAFVRASSFYDDVWQHRNDNDSPQTVNKTGPVDEFSRDAREVAGSRSRFLDAYLYGSFQTGEQSMLNLRAGRQVVQWGESLFFPNIAGAQSPADATKANVPGVEVKDILLPVGQVFGQWQLSQNFGLSAYYQYEYKATELDPVGSYFSYADMIGPGAEFIHVIPGFFSIPKGPDDEPRDSGQWGLSTRFTVGGDTELGLYHLRYHDKNPNLVISEDFSQYQVVYFDDIKLSGASFSTRLGDFNVAGEVSYKDGVPVLVDGPVGPSATRAKATQAQLSSLYILGPRWYSDQTTFVGEVAYLRVNKVEDFHSSVDGTAYDDLSVDRSAWAYQLMATPSWTNVIDGWDLSMPISYAQQLQGTAAVAGAFGGLIGEGDRRASLGLTAKYLNNLELGMTYNAFLGDADLAKRPLADRDYLSVSAKYSF